jgi:hypothetical protein
MHLLDSVKRMMMHGIVNPPPQKKNYKFPSDCKDNGVTDSTSVTGFERYV